MTQTIESSTCDRILFGVSPFSRNGGVMSRGRPAVLEYHSTEHSGVSPHTNKHIHLRLDHRIKPLWFPAWSVRSRLSPRLVSARQHPTWFSRHGELAMQIVQEEIRDLLAVSVRKHAPRTRSVALKMCVDYSVTGRLGIGPSSSGCTGATRDGVTMQERDPRRRSGPGGHYGATCA